MRVVLTSLVLIGFLLVFMSAREVMNWLERRELIDKLMSRDFNDYLSARTYEKVKILREKNRQDEAISI